MPTIEDVVSVAKKNEPNTDEKRIRDAYAFAQEAHEKQSRASGEPYVIHALATAARLAEMKLPSPIVIAGLLHDVPEETNKTLEEISERFGSDVAGMVAGVTKLGRLKYRGIERYVENLRNMFLSLAKDMRVIIIKFADRLHNLETLNAIPPKKAYRIALESLQIFAPIANRLGMGEMKGSLEDASFKYVYPKEYEWTLKLAQSTREGKREYLNGIMESTRKILKSAGIAQAEVHGRAKHLYSLYRKLLKNDRDISRIYDLMAIRIIVPTIADCYATLGVIHGTWTPLKGRIKDYIAQPKPNGYASLHTTVFCDEGEIMEFQIRTPELHSVAEYGVAAHWQYDETKGRRTAIGAKNAAQTDWMRQINELTREIADAKQYMKTLEEMKIDIFKDRIFVFTPKGDVIDLPEDSTPVDFAYAIHTEVGNKCSAAKVNDKMERLNVPLKSGDVVEIIVDKSRKGPNPDWLKSVKTRYARSKIRQQAQASIKSWIKGFVHGEDA
jgi:guanosine-3',5'-bis(diphosphate) 3'-pyrophosphohydrolase